MAANVVPLRSKAQAGEQQWLSPEQVCERVPGMTIDRLKDMRKRGVGPKYYKPTLKTVTYSSRDIDTWVESTVVTTREQS
ncbi:helix-turn-helix transcriptional regulator [Microbacterium album]|uniref:Uncharacterized protein n=1 Tax=Microbacterium album TaxID=2053191 RepID=A0A917IB42_9MICO|nr:hypothetical protein [Microbacterium album]GGH33941.1 hypothetical protein GCM10010921_01260 [Microbacterium album]